MYYTTFNVGPIYNIGPDRLELIIFDIINKKICNHPCRLQSVTEPHYQFFVCNHKQFPYDYRQKIVNVAQLQIIDDKEDYRLFC